MSRLWHRGCEGAGEKGSVPFSSKTCPQVFELDLGENIPRLELGAGVAVSLGDFYVIAPSAVALSSGSFEQPDSLRLALMYRDRLSQVIIDRKVRGIVREEAGNGEDRETIAKDMAFAVLNEGWGWEHRRKSN